MTSGQSSIPTLALTGSVEYDALNTRTLRFGVSWPPGPRNHARCTYVLAAINRDKRLGRWRMWTGANCMSQNTHRDKIDPEERMINRNSSGSGEQGVGIKHDQSVTDLSELVRGTGQARGCAWRSMKWYVPWQPFIFGSLPSVVCPDLLPLCCWVLGLSEKSLERNYVIALYKSMPLLYCFTICNVT